MATFRPAFSRCTDKMVSPSLSLFLFSYRANPAYSIGLRRKGIRRTCTRFRNWSYTRVQRECFVQNIRLMDYRPWHITNIVFSHSLCDYPYRRCLGNDHLANQGKHVDVVHLVTLSMVPNDIRRDNARNLLRVIIYLLYGAYSFGRCYKYKLLSLFWYVR